jgi:hypothetical protein
MRHVVTALLVVLCLAAGNVSAATFEKVTDAALVERSNVVVVGHVLDAASRQRADGSIVTDYRLAVEDVLKGQAAGTITITEFGGMANGLLFIVPGSVTYTTGSRVVAFLNARTDGTFFTSHMALGRFAFESRRNVEVLTRDERGVEMQDQTRALQPRDPGQFLTYVREAARGAQVDEYAPSAELPPPSRLTPRTEAAGDYAIVGGPPGGPFLPVRWEDCETNCVIGYFWNGDQPGVANDAGSIENAMSAWTGHSGSNVNLGLGGNTTATNLTNFDGENSILLNNTSSPDFGLCNGSVACGGIWGNGTHSFRSQTFYSAIGGDMLVRPGTYSSVAFESIVAHELGHTIGLRHSNDGTPSSNSALMRSIVPLGGAVLQQWDKDAMSELYGEGVACVGPSNLVTSGGGTIFAGQTRTLSVTAQGTTPFTYQWYRGNSGDTSNPVGTNSSQFTTPPLTDTTTYWVKVSGCTPAVIVPSGNITITVQECPAPTITAQPQNKNISPNTTTTLSVTASGGAPFGYQWYQGQSGDTSNPRGNGSQNFTTPQLTQTTSYWVKVTNDCDLVALSDTATVTVQECPKPAFTSQPASQTIASNATATLTVTTTSNTAVTYEWYRGEVGDTANKVGTNSPTFTTPALTQTTSYWVRAKNTCGNTDSAKATITVGAACTTLSILNIPSTVNLSLGDTVSINVTPGGTGPFTYQWYQGLTGNTAAPIATGTNSNLPLGPFNTTGTFNYWVKVTDKCNTSINSPTVVVSVACGTPDTPVISAPSISHYTAGYEVSWIGNLVQTPKFELQEARDENFTVGLKTFQVTGALEQAIAPHLEIATDTRFYYRVRGLDGCTQLPTAYSKTTNTVITRPQATNSSEFSISVPESAAATFKQDYLVPGFGATATNADTFSIATDAPWLTVFPQSGALSAGGTTVQFTINPSLLDIGSSTGTVVVNRTSGAAARGGVATEAVTKPFTLPFTVSKVTPVTPAPRDPNAPPGTLLIPAVAHATGIGTHFQSDVRIVNASGNSIDYELSFTPSQTNGTQAGKQLPLTIDPNDTKGLDDIVKAWFGSGLLGEGGLGTLEIRPLNNANPQATFASSRTYAVDSTSVSSNADCKVVRCTLGQFIPALGLDKFVGNVSNNSLDKISLQQISNSLDSTGFRTNLGFVEGSGSFATMRLTLRDGATNSIIKQVERNIQPYGHEQTSVSAVFGPTALSDGRVEVEVISPGGKVSSYASVVDNATSDPLLVFPVQAQRVAATHYVVPGVAELDNGPASNFHTDMRIYNAGLAPVTVSVGYFPQTGDSRPRPANVNLTINPGQVRAINNVLPELFQLSGTGGAVAIDAPGTSSLVVTARTYSRDAKGGTYGQFIPGVTAADGVGLADRALEVLQLEQSDQYRTNLGLVEVTGNPVTVEVLGQTGNKITARTEFQLSGNEFRQVGRVFEQLGFTGASYTGRVSVKVIGGNGRVAAYGSVVDNKTVDPTYVPAQ